MRLITFQADQGPRLGAVLDDRVVDLARASNGDLPDSMLGFVGAGPSAWDRARDLVARAGGDVTPLASVRILAPIPRPRKNIVCLGLNYRDHAEEAARAAGKPLKLPEHPIYFTKPATSVIGPDEAIVYDPSLTTEVDWEVELTLVIGKAGRDIAPDRVMEHMFGYTAGNDVSARDLQFRHGGQWFKGKSLDTFAPIGPCIVTADELTAPGNLDVRCRVNGVDKQSSNTRELIFDIPSMVSILSAGVTLEPGDLIMTGTPHGVGFARTPPEFLRNGDVVEVEIEGIGTLRNPVVTRSAR
jgi:2-keto-4-pentenoate hydratase/2-oxohepta-3-ene-1,7-dioic acid hydratase in catechol pathway